MEKAGPRKVLRAPALRRGREVIPLTERVKLEQVLGLTVSCNAALDCDPQTSIVSYTAGCVIVLYNIRKNKQNHILSASKKTITALAFSWDGKYLVTGECGHQPHVRVWDVQEHSQVAEFSGHKYGINCVAFSPNLKYVVSVGTQHDMIVNVWEWKTNVKIASNKVSCKVKAISFASNGNYFVTVGNRHVKFWYLEYSRSTKYKLEPVPLMGRSAILGDQRNNYFFDVSCGRGDMADSTYAITKSGLLCEFNSRRLLDKWVELRTSSANCISVGEDYIFVGCAEGLIRCFSPFNLHFICTLPRPHYLGINIDKGITGRQLNPPPSGAKFPDVIAICLDEKNRKVTCIYNDHSMYIWDIKDMKKIGKIQSFLYHSACIWGVETYSNVDSSKNVLPKGTFLTCSSDDTIRIWNLEANLIPETSYHHNIYSFELLKLIYTDEDLTYLCDLDFSPSGSNDKVDTTYDGKNGVRCLRISPDGQHLSAGDRSGNIRVFDLKHMEELCKIEAHDAEVLCLEYSKPIGTESRYLASASRDRLIHVFDVNQDYEFQQTLDDHSSSITAIRFVQNNGQLQMISCAADKSIIFRRAQFTPQLNFVREHHVVGKTTLYDMEIDSQQSNILTACQDRNIRVYSVNGGKHSRCFRGSQGEDGTLIKVILDPSGTYLATSCTDKSLNIYDYYSGECLASMFGHSELVTGLKFTNCGKYLISVSGDGCIFMWKLPVELTQAILNRQSCLDSSLPNLWHDNSRKATVAVTKPIQIVERIDEKKEFITSLLKDREEHPSPYYRFSMGPLPLWAKKQMLEEVNSTSTNMEQQSQQALPPRGRWAQRLDEGGLVVRSYLNSDSVIPFPNVQDSETNFQSQFNDKNANIANEELNDDSFTISPESLQEIQDGFPLISNESNGHVSLYRGDSRMHMTNGKQETINHLQTDSSSTSSLQLEDVEAEDERSDNEMPDSNEMVYYPQSDNSDSSFRICATDENQVQFNIPKKPEKLNSIPAINVTDQGETHSDEDEPGTPVDGDHTFGNFSVSTENLDKLGQRELFMKSNYESLEKNSPDSDTERESEERNNCILPRYSISARFLAKSLQAIPRRSDELSSNKYQPEYQNNNISSKKREELNKALGETRRKLETLGWRGGLSSSKSISDLHNIPDKNITLTMHSKNRSGNLTGNIRKAASLNDLSIVSSSPSPLLPVTSDIPKITAPKKVSAPLWDQVDNQSHRDVWKPITPRKKIKPLQSSLPSSPMSQKLARSASMSVLSPIIPKNHPTPLRAYPKGKSISSRNIHSMNSSGPLLRAASSSNINNSEQVDSLIFSSKKNYVNNLDSKLSSDSSSPENSPAEIKRNLPLTPSTFRERSLSIGESTKKKLFQRELKSQTKNLSNVNTLLSHSKSEWDLSKSTYNQEKRRLSGRLTLDKLDAPTRKKQTGKTEIQPDDKSVRNYNSLSRNLKSLDVSSVPLTQDLCRKVAEELKDVTAYAMQVFQRLSMDTKLSPSEKSTMTTTIAQGVWQAQQNLRPAIPPIPFWSSVPNSGKQTSVASSHAVNEFSPDGRMSGPAVPQESLNAILLLQEYSDKLLSIVEQRIGNSQKNSD